MNFRFKVSPVLFLLLTATLAVSCSQKISGTLPDQKQKQETKHGPTSETGMNQTGQTSGQQEMQDQVFIIVEQMPQFPGGEYKMNEFLNKNINYPKEARENNESGRVMVDFIVTKEGDIINPMVVRGVSRSIDEEALRVVKTMPRWIPGKQNGRPVAVKFTMPLTFRLD